MGIEQSSYQSPQPRSSSTASTESGGAIPRSKPRQDSSNQQAANESGRSSPHPSVCSSDADVPYVSYTVNKPIGGIYYLNFKPIFIMIV
jgi:hypothetical protein